MSQGYFWDTAMMQHDCNCWMAFAGSLRKVQKTLFLQYFEMEPCISTEIGWNMGGRMRIWLSCISSKCAIHSLCMTRYRIHKMAFRDSQWGILQNTSGSTILNVFVDWTYSFSEWQTWLHSSKSCFGFIFSMTWHGTFYDWYHPFCCSFSCCLLFVVVAVFVVVVLCVLFVVVVKSMSIKCQ